MFYFYLCFVLFIPQVCHSSSQDVEKPSNPILLINKPIANTIQTKIPTISEGGIIPNNTVLEENHTKTYIVTEYDKDRGKSKPRKGAIYSSNEDKSESFKNNSMNKTLVNNLHTLPLSKNVGNNETGKNTTLKNIVHKPLILSYEALSQMDKDNNIVINDNEPSIKIHASKLSGHPGMIMPIVITILVVPMFAVVGFMALKRGKEAWKNRHYKRMDFLLDENKEYYLQEYSGVNIIANHINASGDVISVLTSY